VIVTPTERDALVLGTNDQGQPAALQHATEDDKSFPTSPDTRTDFAAPYITRATVKGVRYFGPFVDVRALRTTWTS